MSAELARYDPAQSYAWNYEHAPDPPRREVIGVPGRWTFCNRSVSSPLGIPAGPLLNGRWCLYYAGLGFDVLTYKTVRSGYRPCYELPNLLPVTCPPLQGGESDLRASSTMEGSWAVAFGMPSMSPDTWRADVEWTRRQLADDKVLVVSIVGTMQPGWTLDELSDDYARCIHWAVDSGADAIEVNFSCPNVDTCDGQLFQQPSTSASVAGRAREAAGSLPLIVKIGHIADPQLATDLLLALAPHVSAVSMTNSIAATVVDLQGQPMFGGQRRGICGKAILEASLNQVKMMAETIARHQLPLQIIGVGGASSSDDVCRYLDAGAHHVQIATAAMVDPSLGLAIRAELAAQAGASREA